MIIAGTGQLNQKNHPGEAQRPRSDHVLIFSIRVAGHMGDRAGQIQLENGEKQDYDGPPRLLAHTVFVPHCLGTTEMLNWVTGSICFASFL